MNGRDIKKLKLISQVDYNYAYNEIKPNNIYEKYNFIKWSKLSYAGNAVPFTLDGKVSMAKLTFNTDKTTYTF